MVKFLFAAIFIFSPVILPAQDIYTTPIHPKANSVVADSSVLFEWNQDPYADSYEIQVAFDSLFNVVTYTNSTADLTDTLKLSNRNRPYYWRVRSFRDGIPQPWSYIRRFYSIDVTTFPSTLLWLNEDSKIDTTSSGLIQNVYSVHENNFFAQQSNTNLMPTIEYDSSTINFKNIRFDGNNDYLTFSSRFTNVRSVYWLIEEDPDATANIRFLLSDNNTFDFHRGGSGSKLIFNNQFAAAEVIQGKLKVNNENVDGTKTNMPTGLSLISLRTTGNTEASRFSMDRANNERVWDGRLAELIILSEPLNNVESQFVEKYIAQKHYPPVDLGRDTILPYGFCSTVKLEVASYYTDYQWSTGEDTEEIAVNQPGKYWIKATDPFGYQSVDTIRVRPNLPQLPLQRKICLSDSLEFDIFIDSTYKYKWQGIDTNETTKVIKQPGSYTYTIIDSNGCTLSETVDISTDSFSNAYSLGPDTSICAGESISVYGPGSLGNLSYNWSTGATTPDVTINNQGTYSVTVTNSNNCKFRDTIEISILSGGLPSPDFTFSSPCTNDTVTFTDNSIPPSGSDINSWQWSIGDTATSGKQNPSYKFNKSGKYDVSLTVSTVEGCTKEVTKNIEIHPPPIVDFSQTQLCHAIPIEFTDQSAAPTGFMTDWHWNFGDGNSSIQRNPTHTYEVPGKYDMSLVAGSNHGCFDTLKKTILVVGSPIANFGVEDGCIGQVTQFTDSSDQSFSSPIINRNWEFGNNNTSNARNPVQLYQQAGTYEVKLTVYATNGCSTDTTKTVRIADMPKAAFEPDTVCAGEKVQYVNQSNAFGDSIVQYTWRFEDGPVLSEHSPTHTFETDGLFDVSLAVENTIGCHDSINKSIKAAPHPDAALAFDPPFGAAPFDVTLQNTTPNPYQTHWRVTDSVGNVVFTSTETNPQYEFTQNGDYEVRLVTENIEGCADTTFKTLVVAVPKLDIWLQELFVDQQLLNDGTYSIGTTVRLRNTGTRTIHNVDLFAKADNRSTFIDQWSGTLQPGQTTTYQMGGRLFLSSLGDQSFVCVEAKFVNGEPDENQANNILCEPLSDIIRVLPPFPSPASDQVTFDIITPGEDNLQVKVFDETGRHLTDVYDATASQGLNRFEVNANLYAEGLYFLRVTYQGEQYVEKFAVVR